MEICDDAWREFLAYSKAIYWHHKMALDNKASNRDYCSRHNHDTHEPDIFDVFNMIRERKLGGWTYTQKAIDKLDKEIDREFRAGKW